MTLGIVNIGDTPVKMACSADTLRQYRIQTGRDLLKELSKLTGEDPDFDCIHSLAYVMAKQGDPSIDIPINEWLDQFGPMDVLNAASDIMSMWGWNTKETSTSKKK